MGLETEEQYQRRRLKELEQETDALKAYVVKLVVWCRDLRLALLLVPEAEAAANLPPVPPPPGMGGGEG